MQSASVAGEVAKSNQFLSQRQSSIIVHVQKSHRSTADRRQANYLGTDGHKVVAPRMAAGMKQLRNAVSRRVNGRQVRSLVGIAPIAGQTQVVGIIIAAVLLGDNVFNVERVKRNKCLGDVTVLAEILRAANDN